jgi:uncharacterized protein (DUF433 family)
VADDTREIQGWTTAQAAFIVGEDPQAFTKVIERSPVKPQVVRRGRLSIRYFGLADLVYIHALGDLTKAFTVETRADLYVALKHAPGHGLREIAFGAHKYNIHRHLRSVQAKVKQLEKLSSRIDTSRGEALIKGTTIEAYRVAALLDGGMTIEEVLGDYPSLNAEKVLAAKAYSEANPKPGRPFPKRTAKAAMRGVDLAALDAFADPPE